MGCGGCLCSRRRTHHRRMVALPRSHARTAGAVDRPAVRLRGERRGRRPHRGAPGVDQRCHARAVARVGVGAARIPRRDDPGPGSGQHRSPRPRCSPTILLVCVAGVALAGAGSNRQRLIVALLGAGLARMRRGADCVAVEDLERHAVRAAGAPAVDLACLRGRDRRARRCRSAPTSSSGGTGPRPRWRSRRSWCSRSSTSDSNRLDGCVPSGASVRRGTSARRSTISCCIPPTGSGSRSARWNGPPGSSGADGAVIATDDGEVLAVHGIERAAGWTLVSDGDRVGGGRVIDARSPQPPGVIRVHLDAQFSSGVMAVTSGPLTPLLGDDEAAAPHPVRHRARSGARPGAARRADASQRAAARPRLRRGHDVERAAPS